MAQSDSESAALVICIDGPSGAGKGTVARRVANMLNWHLLDSGALYRLVGLCARNHGVDISNEEAIRVLAEHLDVQFIADSEDAEVKIVLEGETVTHDIRTEQVGKLASEVAALPMVREALLLRQRSMAEAPGLVADGRDMGTVVFPEASVKVFLTASAEERALRRYKQLKEKGFDASLDALLADIKSRDDRDMNRAVAPLVPAPDALEIDSTKLSIEQVTDMIVEKAKSAGLA